jgi:cyanophycinase
LITHGARSEAGAMWQALPNCGLLLRLDLEAPMLCRFLTVFVCVIVLSASASAQAPRFDYYLVGDPTDVSPPTSWGLNLMGGGGDVDEAFQWMCEKAGRGDFVIIRASGADAYGQYLMDLCAPNSIQTFVTKNRAAAFDTFVVETIRNAEALFIAGGDQANYFNFWKDTPVEDAIHHLASRNVPIGGNSAGLAILGEFAFVALNGTITSSEALANCLHRRISLTRDFLHLPNMENLLTDSHLVERDRMGRFVTFLARIVHDGWSSQPAGIGLDGSSAVVVEPDGHAVAMGGPAYFLRTSGSTPETCAERLPVTFRNVSVYRLQPGAGSFNLARWKGTGGTAYTLSAEGGVLVSSQAGGEVY